MNLTKYIKLLIAVVGVLLFGSSAYGQPFGGNAYLMGDGVEVGVDGERGREGTDDIAGSHARGGAGGSFGFVANPALDGWVVYDGDFFTPGSPENGFGIEVDGTSYSNNFNVYEIIADSTRPITHTVDGSCITVEWTGQIAGVDVILKYHLFTSDLFYTTEVTLVNTTATDMTDVYYYRNVDPDNNQPLSFDFQTENTIVSQPGDDCQKALVSAEQDTPHDSYLGFGALGENWRVMHGGFSNRDGSDIWDASPVGFENAVGSSEVADEAIAIAYKTDILAGDTANFTFAIVLSEDALEGAFASLYYIDYESIGSAGGGVISQCNPSVDSVQTCAGNGATLSVEGPNAGDFSWEWTPSTGLSATDEPTTFATPVETTTYTVTGTPISACLTNTISKTIVVVHSEGPQLSITDPGQFCDEFDLDDLEFEDLNDIDGTVSIFLTEFPDSAKQTSPEWPDGDLLNPGEEVYLMIADTANGCYSAQQVIIDFGGAGSAGADSTIMLCGEAGATVDLNDLIEPGANIFGSFTETSSSGQFNAGTGVLTLTGLSGTYTFTYSVASVPPCPPDEAIFTVVVYGQPNADFEYSAGGLSSDDDGITSTCIVNTVSFEDESTISGGGSPGVYTWDFGDGSPTTSTTEPTHSYAAAGEGTYTVTLTIVSPDGCISTHTKDIIIYEEPILDIVFNEPSCFGLSDGSITVFVEGGSGSFDITITDSDGAVKNSPGSNVANVLNAGLYDVVVTDASGCSATGTALLTEPAELEVEEVEVVDPLCFGGTGFIDVDSVVGESDQNPIQYYWNPNPNAPQYQGYGADSIPGLPAGEYVLTIIDANGCSNIINYTIVDPPQLKFNDLGAFPTLCRTASFQSGTGTVFVSAEGGTGSPTYEWQEDATGDTSPNVTWGGRDYGSHTVTVTDAVGCTLTGTVFVDSLKPNALFTVNSAQLNSDCKGTADVEVSFTNQSTDYFNPQDPDPNYKFYWDLDHIDGDNDWDITEDYNYEPDTTYEARGSSYIIEVCLIVQNQNDCQDEYCKPIEVFEPISFTNVNIFTPNGDGSNDIFTFSQYAASISEFNCVIVNRWGVQVGEINDINGGWNGTDNNGSVVNNGVYFYTYKAVSDDGTLLEGQGTVQVAGVE